MALSVVVTYDIADDRRRSRLAALLQSYGDRIQESVFLLNVPSIELDALIEKIEARVEVDRDSVYVLRQCLDCWQDRICIGQAEPPARVLCHVVM